MSAVGLIRLIYTVNDSITAVRVGPAAPFITLKGIVTTVSIRWGNRIILDAVPLIGLKLHTIRTTAYPTEIGSWETEVAAEPIGHRVTAAGDSCGRTPKNQLVNLLIFNYD